MTLTLTGRVGRVACDGLRLDGRWYRLDPHLAGPRPIPGDLVEVQVEPATGDGRPIVVSVSLIRGVRYAGGPRRRAA